jgi:septal ring factor EnvC (AmiA/AmiB activator)
MKVSGGGDTGLQPICLPCFFLFIMKNNILSEIVRIEDRINTLDERSYNLDQNSSELREINKRRKKLQKNRDKLLKKLGHHETK